MVVASDKKGVILEENGKLLFTKYTTAWIFGI